MQDKSLRRGNIQRSNKKRLSRMLLFFVIPIVIYQASLKFLDPALLPIHHVKLSSDCEHVSAAVLKQKIKPYIKGFFSTKTHKLKTELAEVPCVDDVIIKRIWPDTLLVHLTEQQLIARWGRDAVVTSKGNVLKIKTAQTLPLFNGPEGQANSMLETYNQLLPLLQPVGHTISEVNLSTRRAWEITLDDGIKIMLGRKDLVQRIEKLTSLWPKLVKLHGESLDTIDLRYPNGISIHLK